MLSRNRQQTEPRGENQGVSSRVTTQFLWATSSGRKLNSKPQQENFQQNPRSPDQRLQHSQTIMQSHNQTQRSPYQIPPVPIPLQHGQAPAAPYLGMSDSRFHPTMDLLQSKQMMHPQSQPIYVPMPKPGMQPQFPHSMQQIQSNGYHLNQAIPLPQTNLDAIGLGPQIQLSQRQMELFVARQQMHQKQQMNSTLSQPERPRSFQPRPENPVFFTRSNVEPKSSGFSKQDPPDKDGPRVGGPRDPPTAGSVATTSVETKDIAKLLSTTRIDRTDTDKNQISNAEQQRKFLRTMLQKSGSQSVTSTSSSSSRVSKALVKKVLQKGVTSLASNEVKKKNPSVSNRDPKAVGSAGNSSLRERFFRRIGGVITPATEDTYTVSASASSESSGSAASIDSDNRGHQGLDQPSHTDVSKGSGTINDGSAVAKTLIKVTAEDNGESEEGLRITIRRGTDLLNNNQFERTMASEHNSHEQAMTRAKTNETTSSLEESEYEEFLASLQKEVFSGQFTQLWASFATLLMPADYQEPKTEEHPRQQKTFKIDQHTKQVLKEMNHYAKKCRNVECFPRSQVMNDKNFYQENPDYKLQKVRKAAQSKQLAAQLDPILTTRSYDSIDKDSNASNKYTTPAIENRNPHTDQKHIGDTTSTEQGQNRGKDLQSIPDSSMPWERTLHNINICEINITSEIGNNKSRDFIDVEPVTLESQNPLDEPRVNETGASVKLQHCKSQHNSVSNGATDSGDIHSHSSSSVSFPWIEGRDRLRPIDTTKVERHSIDSTHSSEKLIDARLSPKWSKSDHSTISTSKEPAWKNVTLRHVDVGNRERRSVSPSSNSNESLNLCRNDAREISSSLRKAHPPGDDNVGDDISGRKKTIDYATNIDSETSLLGSQKEVAVIVKLVEEAKHEHNTHHGPLVEGRVIVGKSTLMKVHSIPGESQATVQWKVPREDVESMTLDMAKKQVNLFLMPTLKSSHGCFVLDFGTEEDCLKFANAFYEMATSRNDDPICLEKENSDSVCNENVESIKCRSLSVIDKFDDVSRFKPLNEEEQNVLETYRRLRQTKAPEEALNESLNESISKKKEILESSMITANLQSVGTPEDPTRQNSPMPPPAVCPASTFQDLHSGLLDAIRRIEPSAPLNYVVPPDLPSSPVSTFSNSVCTALTTDDDKIAEKYRKMLRLIIPPEADRHKMVTDNMEARIKERVFDAQETPMSNIRLTPDEEIIVSKYKKMIKFGLEEEAVRHKMKQDEHTCDKIIAAVFGCSSSQTECQPNLTKEDEASVAKFRHFLKIGMPEDAVRHKMEKENVDIKIVNIIFGTSKLEKDDTSQAAVTEVSSTLKKKLSTEDETVASHYRKMLKLQIPKDAVLSRMEKDGVSNNIITAVIGHVAMLAKSKALSQISERSDAASSTSLSGSNLINFHWNVLSGKAIPGSVWAKVNATGVDTGDVSELIELFQKKTSHVSGKRGVHLSDDISCGGSSKVKLLDLTRTNNVSISLKAFKEFSYSELADIIAFVDPNRKIRGERSQFVRDLLPTAPEIKIVEAYNDTEDRLLPAELWFRKLVGVKRMETKAQVIRTMEMLSSEIENVRSNFNLLQKVCRQVMSSERLQVLLQAVLIIGNILNEGTRNGDAAGFRFDSLLRLTQTKASDGKTTVLDYLVKEFAEKGQRDILVLTEDFPECQTASRMLISDMTNEVEVLQSAIDQCKKELVALKLELENQESSPVARAINVFTDVHSSCRISPHCSKNSYSLFGAISRLSEFIDSVEQPFALLKNDRDTSLRACKDLAQYSGEPGGVGSTTTILAVLSEFASSIEAALRKYDESQRTAARKQKAQESKDIKAALSKIDSSTPNPGDGKSLVLLVNNILRNANPQFKEDFKKGRYVHNPSSELKAIYEQEKVTCNMVPLQPDCSELNMVNGNLEVFKKQRLNEDQPAAGNAQLSPKSTSTSISDRGNSTQSIANDLSLDNGNKIFQNASCELREESNSVSVDKNVDNSKCRTTAGPLVPFPMGTDTESASNVTVPNEQLDNGVKENEILTCDICTQVDCSATMPGSFLKELEEKNVLEDLVKGVGDDKKAEFMFGQAKNRAFSPDSSEVLILFTPSTEEVKESPIKAKILANPSIGRLLDPDDDDEHMNISGEQKLKVPIEAEHLTSQSDTDNASATEEMIIESGVTSNVSNNNLAMMGLSQAHDQQASEQRCADQPSVRKTSVSDVVKRLQEYALVQQEHEVRNLAINSRSSLPTVQKTTTVLDQSRRTTMGTPMSRKIPNGGSDIDQKKESLVARMARLKREEKTARKSTPILHNASNSARYAQVNQSTTKPLLARNAKADKSPGYQASSTPAESSMSRLARQKRDSKRLTK